MPTREQLTSERVRELITELGEAGIIDEGEAEQLTATREFNEARDVRETAPEPPAVTRAKVSPDTHAEFGEAYENENELEALGILWETLTGIDVREGEHKEI